MSSDSKLALCLDFGGTKLAAGIIDLCKPELLESGQVSARSEDGAEGNVRDILELSAALSRINDIEAVGVTFGGYARANQVLRSLHVPGWDHFPLTERLAEHFHVDTVRLANDANAIALGEYRYGAGRGAESMLFVTVSTGVGGGIILDGKLHEGSEGISGEIGHLVVEPNGRLCNCGGHGCVEAVASGPAIAERAKEILAGRPDIQSSLRDEPVITAFQIAQHAEAGDTFAAEQMRTAARYLGLAIGNAINLLDVERVVIGGGVSRSGSVWWNEVRATVTSIVLPWHTPVEIVPSALGTREGLWGAAALLTAP